MINSAEEISKLLNDSEINVLADLYLACFGLDRGSLSYRRLRNALLLVPHSANGLTEVCKMLSLVEETTAADIEADLIGTIRKLNPPPDVTFNAHYTLEYKIGIRMPEKLKPSDVIMFLGTAFLYLINTNYSK